MLGSSNGLNKKKERKKKENFLVHFSELDSAQRSHPTNRPFSVLLNENNTHRTGCSQNQQLVKAANRVKSGSFSDNLVQKTSERKCLAGLF